MFKQLTRTHQRWFRPRKFAGSHFPFPNPPGTHASAPPPLTSFTSDCPLKYPCALNTLLSLVFFPAPLPCSSPTLYQDPKISSYYGVSKIDEGTGALRFALEGRPYDWSHFHRDERSKARLAGWTCAAAGEDTGRRTFASCGSGGASVKASRVRGAFLVRASGSTQRFVVASAACTS